MELEEGKLYILIKGASYAHTIDENDLTYTNMYITDVVKIVKVEQLNAHFKNVIFQNQGLGQADKSILFCDDKMHECLPVNLIRNREYDFLDKGKVLRCYPISQLPFLFYNVNTKITGLMEHIKLVTNNRNREVQLLRAMLQNEMTDAKIETKEFDTYNENVNEFLT